MSLASKITLGIACVGAAGIIFYVHWKQKADQKALHEGVIKDVERQQKRKVENLYWLQQQIEMSKILKNQQSHDEAVALQLLENSEKSKS